MSAYDAAAWTDLFVASAGASAALTGLVFVAVSINIERILELDGIPERALETILLLLGAVVVSIFALVPGQSTEALGAELLGTSLVLCAAVDRQVSKSLRTVERKYVPGRLIVAGLGTLPLLIGGISLLAGVGGGLYWIVAGVIGAIVGGVMNAWVLLVEIRR